MAAPVRDPKSSPPDDRPAARARTTDAPKRSSADRSSDQTDDGRSTRASGDGRPRKQTSRRRDGPHSTAEWITLAISSLIVFGLVGLTSYFYLTASTAPAIVEAEPRLAETLQAGTRFYLPVTVRNSGGETAEEVRVRVTLTDVSGRQETAELQVQFLAGGGSSHAVVAFASDPRLGQIEAGVMSYLEP
jgi:uncharacterized protein (TIGR02588 family)